MTSYDHVSGAESVLELIKAGNYAAAAISLNDALNEYGKHSGLSTFKSRVSRIASGEINDLR